MTWYRNGIPLSETPNLRFEVIRKEGDDRGKINSLHINFLRQEDSGMFECMADNEAGDIVGYTWLRVKSKYKPYFLTKNVQYFMFRYLYHNCH